MNFGFDCIEDWKLIKLLYDDNKAKLAYIVIWIIFENAGSTELAYWMIYSVLNKDLSTKWRIDFIYSIIH